jgi:hypothetical protein
VDRARTPVDDAVEHRGVEHYRADHECATADHCPTDDCRAHDRPICAHDRRLRAHHDRAACNWSDVLRSDRRQRQQRRNCGGTMALVELRNRAPEGR